MFKKKTAKKEDEIITELTQPTAGDDWLSDYGTTAAEGELAVDMYQTPNEIIVRAPVAGVTPADIDINVENGVLTIRGERKDVSEIKEDDYYAKECYWGAFSRSVTLPVEVDSSKASAEIPDGILTVRLPKLVRSEGKSVKIKLS